MPNYSYKARDHSGRLIKGIITADNENDLRERMGKSGYFLTYFEVTLSAAKVQTAAISKPITQRDVLEFTIQLAISLDVGISLLAILKDMARTTPSKSLKKIVEDITRRVESGSSMKDALQFHSNSFSKMYISIVSAGESTGKLALVMSDLSKLLDWQMELKARIQEASVYPLILFTVMSGVVLLLIMVVIPRFEPMLKEIGVALPLPTLFVMGLSKFLCTFWWMGLLGMGGLVWFFIYANSNDILRYRLDRLKLKLPIVGTLLNKIALSQFTHTFSLALASGVDVFTAMTLAAEVTGNNYLEKTIMKARDYVNVGEKISASLEKAGDFPGIVVRMINIGEQTGRLSISLNKVNEFYDREVPATVKKMFALFEPIMIVTMGVVVGGISLAVFLPMVQLITNIGN